MKPDKKNLKALLNHELSLSGSTWDNDVSLEDIINLAEDLRNNSIEECAFAFIKSCTAALPFLSGDEFRQWELMGRDILNGYSEAFECCSEFFLSSPVILSIGSFVHLKDWFKYGLEIAEYSANAAIPYFQYTRIFLKHTDIIHVRQWAKWGMRILSSCEGGDEAASFYFRSSVDLFQFLSFNEMREWHALGLRIAKKSTGFASIFFSISPNGLNHLYVNERACLFKLVSRLAEKLPEKAVEFYRKCAENLLDINPIVRSPALKAVDQISNERSDIIIDAFDEIVSALYGLPYPAQEIIMRHGASIGELSIDAYRSYFRNVRLPLIEISDAFLPHWIEKGVSLLMKSENIGIDFFSFKSEEPYAELSKWKEAILLEDHRNVLALFAQALSGKNLNLLSTDELEAGESSTARFYPTSDGHNIYLPPFAVWEPTCEGNFRQYKVATAHQAGYVEFGSFEAGLPAITERLVSLPQKDLALDIFFILEDGRIDRRLKEEYGGLRREIDMVVSECLSRRPAPVFLHLQEALVEVLLRLSVGYSNDEKNLHNTISAHVNFLKDALSGFYENNPGVRECFSKALEIYGYVSRLSNAEINSLVEVDIGDIEHTDGFPYEPSIPFPFRGRLNPELLAEAVQLDAFSDELTDEEGGFPMPLDELKKLLENMKDRLILKIVDGDEISSQGLFITDIDGMIDKRSGKNTKVSNFEGADRLKMPSVSRSSVQEGPFYYDEWDYLQRAYRRRWCCLREKIVDSFDPGRIDKIYEDYKDLIRRVRKQFQRIQPRIIEPVRRVEWGDEIDFTALIQNVVDRRAGDSPSDRIFSRMEKKIRRISTLLLIDMSASTDDWARSAANSNNSSENDPLVLMPDLNQVARIDKKIIDIEIESVVVMMEALHALDDEFAIFGFSGYGRRQVDFYRIKDFGDPCSEAIKSRISGIKPKQSTRMGAAIRHAIGKLRPIESDQRLLILVSDGFPQDHDYGEERRSKEYALHDTMMSLIEAKREGIQPFCITVDQGGHDYLRKMCDPQNYMVIKDIYSLPEIIPRVVESLIS